MDDTVAIYRGDRVIVERDAQVEAYAVLDAREGPVLVRSGARVMPHTRIEGPCVVGPDTHVLGGVIARSTLGGCCRIAGEVEETVWQGFANKRHHGFVGPSWVGGWGNLG